MTTIREVAKLAGVSTATVSRAFRPNTYVSEDTKSKIIDAAKKLNYTPNLMARGLKSQKSNTVGLIVSDIDNPFYSIVTRVLESELKRAGYRLLLSYSHENEQQELEDLMLLASSRVEGIIFTPTSNRNKSFIQSLRNQNIALMQLYRVAYKDVDSIVIDDEKGAYTATKFLLQNGHRNILLLSVDSPISPDRSKGYQTAFAEENLAYDDKMIMHLPFQIDLHDMIAKRIEEAGPTAIIAATNVIGMAVVKVCKEMKLRLGHEISLIMFDDVPWASLLDITTIAQPINNIGLYAGRTIIERMQSPNAYGGTINSILGPQLIVRNSVRNLFG